MKDSKALALTGSLVSFFTACHASIRELVHVTECSCAMGREGAYDWSILALRWVCSLSVEFREIYSSIVYEERFVLVMMILGKNHTLSRDFLF